MSNQGVRGEKIINFHVLVEKRLSIFQLGGEGTPTTKKGGTPMNTTLTTKTKGGRYDAGFYGGVESNAHMVSLALGTG